MSNQHKPVLVCRSRAARGTAVGVLAAVAVTALVVGVSAGDTATGPRPGPSRPGAPAAAPRMALAAYPDCAAMRRALRQHTAAHVRAYGLPGPNPVMYGDVAHGVAGLPLPATLVPGTAVRAADAAPQSTVQSTGQTTVHSGTNDQVAGVDEPDVVKTDGTRLVAISGGVLRVVDVADRTVVGRLDLNSVPGAYGAQLLLSGDRALVIVPSPSYFGGPMMAPGPEVALPARPGVWFGARSTLLLVDVSTTPHVISTLHVQGSYVDARMSGGVARVVVDSQPRLPFHIRSDQPPQRRANRRVVQNAPLADWLPRYTVTAGGATVQHHVPCTAVTHPVRYTGANLLTVYSVDLARGLGDLAPVGLAADAATVYGTPTSLYIASTPRYGQPEARTQVHRFDITRPGRPVYRGTGTVSGELLNSYAMDDWSGHLRVVTTVPPHPGTATGTATGSVTGTPATTRVSILDDTSLRVVGVLDGLGRGQQVEAVRFAGPSAYVVTYRSLDPLYVLDLADPTAPREAGELHVTGYSDYLHPVGPGRLLGVGRTVSGREPDGVQLSLFDVSDPAHPTRLVRLARPGSPDAAGADSHAFLYWVPTGTAVVPLQTWGGPDSGAALVVRVGQSSLTAEGTIGGLHGGGQIERSLVIGSDLWTLSPRGLAVYGLGSLRREAAVRFG